MTTKVLTALGSLIEEVKSSETWISYLKVGWHRVTLNRASRFANWFAKSTESHTLRGRLERHDCLHFQEPCDKNQPSLFSADVSFVLCFALVTLR